jgi:hypothetical protein
VPYKIFFDYSVPYLITSYVKFDGLFWDSPQRYSFSADKCLDNVWNEAEIFYFFVIYNFISTNIKITHLFVLN